MFSADERPGDHQSGDERQEEAAKQVGRLFRGDGGVRGGRGDGGSARSVALARGWDSSGFVR
jgi:hypothetical protein